MAESIALAALDELSVEVISDNVSDTHVSKTPFAASEIDNVVKGGARRRFGAVRHPLPDLRPLHRMARSARTCKRVR